MTQYHPSIVIPLPYPSDDSRIIVQAAQQGLNAIYRKQCLFMKAGVMMLDLMDKNKEQFDLFTAPQSSDQQQKADHLMNTIDLIDKKMGATTIQLGGRKPQAAWHLKREHLSQRYTTRWSELLEVK